MGELLELEHAWARAFQEADLTFIDSLIAAEFRLTFADDPRAPRAINRENWFAALGKMTFGNYVLSEVQEEVFRNRGVLHMHAHFEDWVFDGTVLPTDYVVTDIFVKRAGRWQVINRISEGLNGSPRF